MEPSCRIKESEWFCAIEGLAIAEKVYDFYFEEYDHIPQNKKVGDYNLSMVRYKLFCDFDGHPIKRNRCKIFNAAYCSPMCAKYKEVLKRSIKDNPKEYASFLKFLKIPKEMKRYVSITYALSENTKIKAIQDLEKLKNSLPTKFSFLELLKIATDNQCIIDMTDFIDDTYDTPLFARVYLDYTYGDSIGNRVLFHKLDYEVNG